MKNMSNEGVNIDAKVKIYNHEMRIKSKKYRTDFDISTIFNTW